MLTAPYNVEPELNKFFCHSADRQVVKIMPGECYVTENDTIIATVLGSCVSVCLRDKVRGIGGMNHYMLPYNAAKRDSDAESLRYGDHAINTLIDSLLKKGSRREHLEAKVFGAGKVIKGNLNIGRRNADFALEYLASCNIAVTASDLGDVYPRKVFFAPKTGQVIVRRLQNDA